MAEFAVDISGVEKTYRGKIQALRGISLRVPEGSIFGLLGPNGAGKSTLVKILTTIIRPTKCSGILLGSPVGHKPTLRKVGYLPEHSKFPAYLTGRQVIGYAAGLGGIRVNSGEIDNLLDMVGMAGGAEDRMIKTYSKGMVQRIGIAQALVNSPRLLILDEPTDGVDPEGRYHMRNLLKKLRDNGVTVFVNSHLLGELETLCDSIAILKAGKVVRQGALSELTSDSRGFQVNIEGSLSEEIASRIVKLGHSTNGGEITLQGADSGPLQEVLDVLRAAGVVILEVSRSHQSLEDLFMESVVQMPGSKEKGVRS